MSRDRIEKLGTLFLAVFSTGLTAQLASTGMAPAQWPGAIAAVLGSTGIAAAVRLWPHRQPAAARASRRADRG